MKLKAAAVRLIAHAIDWLRTSWRMRAALAAILAISLPLVLVSSQYVSKRDLPETLSFVPQDADWFVVGHRLADFISLSESQLLHIRSAFGDKNGWPTRDGQKWQTQFDSLAKKMLGGLDYTTLHCLLNQDDAFLSKNGLSAADSAAIFQKDNRTYLVLPTINHRAAVEYLSAALATPSPSVAFEYDTTGLAEKDSYGVSIKISAKGYLPCATPLKATGSDELGLEGTIVPEPGNDLTIKLVPLLNSGLTEASISTSCHLSDGVSRVPAPCKCAVSIWKEGREQSDQCTELNPLPLPQASIKDIDWNEFDLERPVAFGRYSAQKLAGYIVVSRLPKSETKEAHLDAISWPTIGMERDRAFQDSVRTLRSQLSKGTTSVFGGIRPTLGMTLQKEFGIPAIPLYLTTPFVLSAHQNELTVSFNVNLAPQDMELLKLIASKSSAEQSIGWEKQAGSGIQLTFSDPSLRSYPKLLNSIFPEFETMLQSEGRIYPLFFDLLDNGVSTVSFASLRSSDNKLAHVAVVASRPKSDLAGVSALLEGLSRKESSRRKEAILSGMRQYFETLCTLIGSSQNFEDCVRSIIEGDLRRSGKVGPNGPETNSAFTELACLPKGANPADKDLIKALGDGDTSAFGDAILGKSPTFEPDAAAAFPTSVDAEISPTEMVWSRVFTDTEGVSLSAAQEKKKAVFEELISESNGAQEDDKEVDDDVHEAKQLLWTARLYWKYLLDKVSSRPKSSFTLTDSDLDQVMRLWLSTLRDSQLTWSTTRAMHERLASFNGKAPAQGDDAAQPGLLTTLASLPTLNEVRSLCERAVSAGVQKRPVDQQLQVASADPGGPEFALIFYQFGNRDFVMQLEKSLTRPTNVSKLSFAVDGATFLSSEKDAQSNLDKEGIELPYRFLTVNVDGMGSQKGLTATLSLTQEATRQ